MRTQSARSRRYFTSVTAGSDIRQQLAILFQAKQSTDRCGTCDQDSPCRFFCTQCGQMTCGKCVGARFKSVRFDQRLPVECSKCKSVMPVPWTVHDDVYV